jgi:hypothetical protein
VLIGTTDKPSRQHEPDRTSGGFETLPLAVDFQHAKAAHDCSFPAPKVHLEPAKSAVTSPNVLDR